MSASATDGKRSVIYTVAPFTVSTGTPAAFVTTTDHADINQPTIDYLAHFLHPFGSSAAST